MRRARNDFVPKHLINTFVKHVAADPKSGLNEPRPPLFLARALRARTSRARRAAAPAGRQAVPLAGDRVAAHVKLVRDPD